MDELARTEIHVARADIGNAMTARRQFTANLVADLRFQRHGTVPHHLPARSVTGRLRVLPIIGEPHHDLRMALWLHVTAHHAETHQRFSVAGDESRNDGVERPLAGRHLVGVIRRQRESGAAVLQADARARHDNARAKAHVVGLNERDHHAAGVRRREIDRAASGRRAVDKLAGCFWIDQRRTPGKVIGGQQVRRPRGHERRIGNVAIDIGEGKFHRLDLDVNTVGAIDGQ